MQSRREDRHPYVIGIVDQIKSEGIFDTLRRDCLADVDTKPAYQNLKQKVENACSRFLSKIVWTPKINKNQLREQMRKNVEDSGVLQSGVKRIVNQVVTPRIDAEIKPKVAKVVCEYLGLNPDDIHPEDEEFDDSYHQYGDTSHEYPAGVGLHPPSADSHVGLYPYNPLYESAPPTHPPPPLPGFESEYDKPPPPVPEPPGDGAAPIPPSEEQPGTSDLDEVTAETKPEAPVKDETDDKSSERTGQEDMDISEKSSSRSTSRASRGSKNMDCTMTSDEEGTETAAGDLTDLSKGLAAYMAGNQLPADKAKSVTKQDDDMSISSESGTSSKHITPEPSEEGQASRPTSSTSSQSKRKSQATLSTSTSSGGGGGASTQAVPERREMRRQRTRNKKYMSDDFESIFTEKRDLMGDAYNQEYTVEEEIVTTDDMLTQVIIQEETTNTVESDSVARPSSSLSSKESPKAEDSIQPRRSSRRRGTAKEELAATPPKDNDINKSKARSSKASPPPLPAPSQGQRRVTRSSKSVTSLTSDSETSQISTRRSTRSSSKHNVDPITEQMTSGGSTPTQDEPKVPDSLVVLSDICATTERLATPEDDDDNMDISSGSGSRPGSSTPLLDESAGIEITQASIQENTNSVIPEEIPLPQNESESLSEAIEPASVPLPHETERDSIPQLSSEALCSNVGEVTPVDSVAELNTEAVDYGSKDNSLTEDTYEPELHFEQMSAEVTQETSKAPSTRSDDATPTMDEPASPDRLTESPTSPTPGSPTGEGVEIHKSSSMVTIPLDGEDEYFVDSASGTPTIPTELPSDVPTIPIEIPTDVPTIPTEVPLDIQTIPTEPTHNATLSPDTRPPLPLEAPPLPAVTEDVDTEAIPPPPEPPQPEEPEPDEEEGEEGAIDEDDDLEELERLAQRKLEILKAIDIELPDTTLDKAGSEEGEITDSSEDERARSKKSKKEKKKSKKKKNKKEKKRRHYEDEEAGPSKRSRYY